MQPAQVASTQWVSELVRLLVASTFHAAAEEGATEAQTYWKVSHSTSSRSRVTARSDSVTSPLALKSTVFWAFVRTAVSEAIGLEPSDESDKKAEMAQLFEPVMASDEEVVVRMTSNSMACPPPTPNTTSSGLVTERSMPISAWPVVGGKRRRNGLVN